MTALAEATVPVGTHAAVRWADVTLRCEGGWVGPESALRGAVVEALGGFDAHVDWHGHVSETETRVTPATVAYRLRWGCPVVHIVGPLVGDRISELARVSHLLTPALEGVPITSMTVEQGTTDVCVKNDDWYRYQLVSPVFPADHAWATRPREPGAERVAWAGMYLTRSICVFLESVGVGLRTQRPVHVHIAGIDEESVSWEREARGIATRRIGFRARFVSNVVLPPGIGLGRHRAEGFGEVRPC